MEIPDRLDGWTIEVIQRLAGEGLSETDLFDFKAGLQPPAQQTKTCCAFANGRGGFLVYGVSERGGKWEVEGLEPDREFTAKFGARIRADPFIQYPPPRMIPAPGAERALYVVHIPRSPARPHLPTSKEERVFWKRTNVGCEQMTIEEVRAEMMQYEERRERLKLLVVELATNYEIVHSYQWQTGQQPFETPSSAVLDRLLVDAYSLIQRDADLLRDLVRIQREIRKSATRTALLYARMAGGPGMNGTPDGLLAYHNTCLNSDHSSLKMSLESALKTLRERYGLVNPLGSSA